MKRHDLGASWEDSRREKLAHSIGRLEMICTLVNDATPLLKASGESEVGATHKCGLAAHIPHSGHDWFLVLIP